MFTVPIIPSDLRHEETVIKAALALKCLQNTIKCVFDRIDKRVARNNDKVLELQTRVTKVNNKIHSLVGTKKAIKIISPARFPSTHVLKDIPLTFILVPEEENPSTDDIYEIKSRVEAPTQSTIQEKLVLFHVKSISQNENTSEHNFCKGLGEIPSNLKSANSLLLYGTSEIVYGNQVSQYNKSAMSRKVNFSNKPAVKDKRASIELLGPAPHSLTNRIRTDNRERSISYMPHAHDAPQIDVPLDLPDLPGIADDIHFENTDQQQIAPSYFMEILPDLPDTEIKENKNVKEHDFNAERSENDAHLIQIATPPPPPPPPLEQLTSTKKLTNKSTVISSVTQEAPPLPPPPPPPPPPPMTLRIPSPPTIQAQQGLMDAHSNLMDAIRRAGGTQGGKLRNAADTANAEANATARKSDNLKSAGGGDLMADLHNKLLMRRKGISGTKDGVGKITTTPPTNRNASTSNGSKDVFSSLSAVIPVIQVPNRQQNGSDNDEDDDDDNGNETDWAD